MYMCDQEARFLPTRVAVRTFVPLVDLLTLPSTPAAASLPSTLGFWSAVFIDGRVLNSAL